MNTKIARDAYSLDEIADAIRFHMRDYDKSTQTLPREADELCNIYGMMLYERASFFQVAALSDVQQKYVAEALSGQQRLDIDTQKVDVIDEVLSARESEQAVGKPPGESHDAERRASDVEEKQG